MARTSWGNNSAAMKLDPMTLRWKGADPYSRWALKKALACLVSRTEPGESLHRGAKWVTFCRWIGLMFVFVGTWNLGALGRREVWRSANDRRTAWVSLGRPADGEGVSHILVCIYIYTANVNFASQESRRIIHFAICQVTCRCNKWSGF